jgi:hypothetical protein
MKTFARGAAVYLAAAVLVLVAGNASAQTTTWGPRAGMSFDPDQIVLGAHVQLPIATSLYIVPSADLAFGDDAFTIGLHGDLAYRFATEGSVKPYVGGGFSYYSFDPDQEGAESVSETGVGALGGVWLNANGSTPFFVEGKLYFSDPMPDFKVMAGVNL